MSMMHRQKNKIAFFGTPDLAVWVLDALEQRGIVPDLIIAAPDAPRGRKLVMTPPPTKVWADTHGIPALQPEKIRTPEFETQLRDLAGPEGWDLFIVAAYGKIIPENILNLPRRKTINVHPSLLPLLRGTSPVRSAILQDLHDTGVTIMRLDALMDHGPILSQAKANLSIWPVDHEALSKMLFTMGGTMIADLLAKHPSPAPFPETEQDHSKATLTKKISKEDGLLDLSADPYQNWLRYKAFKGWPGSYFFREGAKGPERIVITDATFENGAFVIKKVIPEGKKEIVWNS
jgi:methionyl-tRNA formyltransferase